MQKHNVMTDRAIVIFSFLLLLALVLTFAVREYEQRAAFQWQDMVQPRWEGVLEQQDILEAQTVRIDDMEVAAQPELEPKREPEIESKIEPAQKLETPPAPKPTIESAAKASVVAAKTVTQTKPSPQKAARLKLRVPDNLYKGHTARWESKKQPLMPDFFAPKAEDASSTEWSGKLIVEDDKKDSDQKSDYLDTIKGAEINFSIKMR